MAFQKFRELLVGSKKKVRPSVEITPEQDAATAVEALSAGDLAHATLHIGRALAADASRQDWLHALDQIIAKADDPLALAPIEKVNYSSVVAVHGYILAKQGHVNEALKLIGQVLEYSPTSGYLHWVIGWLEQPDVSRQIDLKPLYLFLSSIANRIEQMAADPAERRGTVDLLLPLVQAAQRCQCPDSEFVFAAVGLLRRVGYESELLPVAEESYRTCVDYFSVNTLAAAYRAASESEHAIAMYQEALTIEPDDRAARLDIADLYAEEANFAEAIRWYGEVVGRFPDDEWALPSSYAAQYMVTKDIVWRQKLDAYTKANPDNARTRMLMGWIASR